MDNDWRFTKLTFVFFGTTILFLGLFLRCLNDLRISKLECDGYKILTKTYRTLYISDHPGSDPR